VHLFCEFRLLEFVVVDLLFLGGADEVRDVSAVGRDRGRGQRVHQPRRFDVADQ
jgi:hypothetical protein